MHPMPRDVGPNLNLTNRSVRLQPDLLYPSAAMDAQVVILLALGCALVGWGVWRLTRKN